MPQHDQEALHALLQGGQQTTVGAPAPGAWPPARSRQPSPRPGGRPPVRGAPPPPPQPLSSRSRAWPRPLLPVCGAPNGLGRMGQGRLLYICNLGIWCCRAHSARCLLRNGMQLTGCICGPACTDVHSAACRARAWCVCQVQQWGQHLALLRGRSCCAATCLICLVCLGLRRSRRVTRLVVPSLCILLQCRQQSQSACDDVSETYPLFTAHIPAPLADLHIAPA
jgi:hypothetical protein